MWYAKPRGAYGINSDEAKNNMFEIYNVLKDEFTIEAICGILGNMNGESGYNPWRWQGDRVNRRNGYGLVQFTPASGYLDDYGTTYPGFAPNLSVAGQTSDANASDGNAQTCVIRDDAAGKYLDRRSWCDYYDLSNTYPFSKFKQITDLKEATIAWLFNYEAPADRSESVANSRYGWATQCYEIITGETPPTPPSPPYPPVPPVPVYSGKMPLWMYLRRL